MVNATKYSAVNLLPELKIDPKRWSRIPSESEINETAKTIEEKDNIKVIRVPDGNAALAKIKEIIPQGAEVMNGSSTTLIEIGYMDLLNSGTSSWKNLREIVISENDVDKRNELRRRSVSAEYFLSGVNAIAMTGEIVSCDGTGSRVGAWPFAAKHLVLVSGVNKIVPTLSDALQRVMEYAFPLEDARAKKALGAPSWIGKCVILANEKQTGRVTLILINECLGY
ncbi:MAG: lactate utilization protein [Methanotrichaceae archaeon]